MSDFDYRGSYIQPGRRSVSPTSLPDGREVRRMTLEQRDRGTAYGDSIQEMGPYTVSRVIRDEKEWAPYRNAAPYSGDNRTTGSYISRGGSGLVGLGVLLEKKDGSPWGTSYVKGLVPGMAGANSRQIQVGDEVVSIDGTTTENKTLDDIKRVSLGQPGTSSTVIVRRGARQFPVTCTRVGGSMPSSPLGTYRSSNMYSSSEYRPTTTSRVVASDYQPSQYDNGSSRVIRDPKDWAQYEGANAGLFSYPPMAQSYSANDFRDSGYGSSSGVVLPVSNGPLGLPVAGSAYRSPPRSPVNAVDNSYYAQQPNGKPLHYL